MKIQKSELAASFFEAGFSCSQAVFNAFSKDFGLDRETALRISQPFGGGMAHMGEACGVLTGAFMVIGLKYGRIKAEDSEAKERTYAKMRQFTERFRALHGSIRCPNLIGVDLGTEEGMTTAREKDLFQSVCAKLVEDAAALLEEIL